MEVEMETRGISWRRKEERLGADGTRKGSWRELKGLKSRAPRTREEGARGRENASWLLALSGGESNPRYWPLMLEEKAPTSFCYQMRKLVVAPGAKVKGEGRGKCSQESLPPGPWCIYFGEKIKFSREEKCLWICGLQLRNQDMHWWPGLNRRGQGKKEKGFKKTLKENVRPWAVNSPLEASVLLSLKWEYC